MFLAIKMLNTSKHCLRTIQDSTLEHSHYFILLRAMGPLHNVELHFFHSVQIWRKQPVHGAKLPQTNSRWFSRSWAKGWWCNRGIWYENTPFIANGDMLGHFISKWFGESKIFQTIRSYDFLLQIIANFDFLIYANKIKICFSWTISKSLFYTCT